VGLIKGAETIRAPPPARGFLPLRKAENKRGIVVHIAIKCCELADECFQCGTSVELEGVAYGGTKSSAQLNSADMGWKTPSARRPTDLASAKLPHTPSTRYY